MQRFFAVSPYLTFGDNHNLSLSVDQIPFFQLLLTYVSLASAHARTFEHILEL